MKISQQGIDLIKQFEGFRAKPYLCSAGVPTIGYGSTRYTDGTKVSLHDPAITEKEATELFQRTLVNYEQAVNKVARVELEQHQFDALVSLCYNIGERNFTSSTLVRLLNDGEAPIDVAAQFLRWNRANSRVIPGLTARREHERALFLGI
jgi:lysozyme